MKGYYWRVEFTAFEACPLAINDKINSTRQFQICLDLRYLSLNWFITSATSAMAFQRFVRLFSWLFTWDLHIIDLWKYFIYVQVIHQSNIGLRIIQQRGVVKTSFSGRNFVFSHYNIEIDYTECKWLHQLRISSSFLLIHSYRIIKVPLIISLSFRLIITSFLAIWN